MNRKPSLAESIASHLVLVVAVAFAAAAAHDDDNDPCDSLRACLH